MSVSESLAQNPITILKGHISPETAYLVEDYPYGFTLRCKIRYWLEYKPQHGCRLMSQTTNPKRGDMWNKPKGSTYARFGGCMFLDEQNHVQWKGLSEYSDGAEAQAFRETYGEGVPEAAKPGLHRWVEIKLAYDRRKAAGEDWNSARTVLGAMQDAEKALKEKAATESAAEPNDPMDDFNYRGSKWHY